ncbi:MAG: hypothetical protein KF699_03085 [Phycisphaeraceae bacterium]|nr:hypothetical protein [Phycisphaeraceae bacterium]
MDAIRHILPTALLQPPTANIAARPEMAQTKVDQTLEPTHRIKFDGSDRISHISFSPDGHTAYCLVPGQRVDLWALGREWWPELLGGVLTLLVLAYLLVLLRVLRRPQRRGAPHCRNCNYDVTVQAPHSVLPRRERQQPARGTLCPECGADLSRKRPRRGRTTARRLLVPTAFIALSAAAYIGLHIARVPRTGPPNSGPEVWSSWVDDFAEQHQLAAILKHKSHVAQIIRVDTQTGTILGTLRTLRGYPAGDMRVSPDGRFIAVVGDKTTLLWIRTSNGRTVARTTGAEFQSGMLDVECVLGISGPVGSQWVYYAAIYLDSDLYRLLRWRPSDSKQEVVIEQPLFKREFPGGGASWSPRQYALLHRPDGVATVSTPLIREAIRSKQLELTIRSPIERGGGIEMTVPVPSQAVSRRIVPSPYGLQVFLNAAQNGIVSFSTQTGQQLDSFSCDQPTDRSSIYQIAISPNGELLYVPGFPNSFLVRDLMRERWAAKLKLPEHFVAPSPEPSQDGRWLAVIAFEGTVSGNAPRNLHELFLFDVSALGKEPPTGSPSEDAPAAP